MLEQLKPNSKTIVSDLVAGLTVSMVNLAELMGYAMVAGVSPIYGLYSGIVAPIVGALTAGSAFMMITLTNETALMTAAMLDSLSDWTIETVFAFTVLTGVFVLILALLKAGTLLRFVSESVMTGFITGTAVLLILGQLHELTGYESEVSGNKVVETVDWLLNPTHWMNSELNAMSRHQSALTRVGANATVNASSSPTRMMANTMRTAQKSGRNSASSAGTPFRLFMVLAPVQLGSDYRYTQSARS